MKRNVNELVIKDLKARKKMGIKKYGRQLHTFNKRSAHKDLYEELLDATQYMKQLMEEHKSLVDTLVYYLDYYDNGEKAEKLLVALGERE